MLSWLCGAGLALNVKALCCDLLYEGDDTYDDFAANGGPEYIDQWAKLQREGIIDPLYPERTLPVQVLHAHDGAVRNGCSGNSSHASTYSSPFNTMTSTESRDITKAGPMTRTPEQMQAAEPTPGLTDSQRQTRARDPKIAGIVGANLLRTPLHRLLAEPLHVELRLCSTTLQNTTRSLLLAKGDLDAFCEHLRLCVGIKARLVWLGDRGVEVCAACNEFRRLLAAGSGVGECASGAHRFLPQGDVGKSMGKVLSDIWARTSVALRKLRQTDVGRARGELDSLYPEMLLLGLLNTAAFGARAVTPTFRMAIDIAPSQQRVRARAAFPVRQSVDASVEQWLIRWSLSRYCDYRRCC